MANISKITMLLLILLNVCAISRPAKADTSIYVFGPDQSMVIKTGGFAGVHITYAVTGQFRLTVDSDAGVASFEIADANLTDEAGLEYGRSLNEIFNMTGLAGIVFDGTTIEFEGKTADGTESDVSLTLSLGGNSAHLTGKTTPPHNSADMFFYDIDAVATKKYAGGTGTAEYPYLIYTAEQMNAIGADPNDWDKHFKLMADIDLSRFTGDAFNIIGYWFDSFDNKPFRGVFDGSGKKISNFSYTSNRNAIGLFGYVDDPNAVIRDLRLIDPNIDAPLASPVGSLLGHLSSGTITNCHVVDGRVLGDYSTGGLVGLNSGTITNCCSSGSVWGNGEGVGGLVGSSEGSITYCYAIASVSGDEEVGGLVGFGDGTISNCYCEAVVSGNSYIGGLVGWNHGAITYCYSTGGSISGNRYIGGLVGYNGYWGTVMDSFWDIEASGQTTSRGGTGKTTAEMQMESTFTDAGWDFVDEAENGTEDIWKISEISDYPRLWWEKYTGGTGEPNDPYQIATADDLITLGENPEDYDKHFILTADIDLDPNLPGRKVFDKAVIAQDVNSIEPDFQGTPFTGVLDGNGYTISHLTIVGKSYLGMFGYLGESLLVGEVRNLGMVDITITGSGSNIGSLVGINDHCSVINCYCNGMVSGDDHVGGLVGINLGDVTDCYSTSTVKGSIYVGGLVGSNNSSWLVNFSNITTSYSTGIVSGERYVGGLVGYNNGKIFTSYSTGTVSGNEYVGGLLGVSDWDVGGCHSYGTVKGNNKVGGLVGLNNGRVGQCSSDTKVTGIEYVGGLVGHNLLSIDICYSSGLVSGDSCVGGLVGGNNNTYRDFLYKNAGTIFHCYSTGSVTGNTDVGGLVGINITIPDRDPAFVVKGCFWDIQTSGKTTSTGGTGKVTTEMQTAATFLEAGWDFVDETANGTKEIWWIDDGNDYPRLRRELVWFPDYMPLEPNEHGIKTFEWVYGKSGEYTSMIGGPETVPYSSGPITGMQILGNAEWGTALFSNDGSSVKLLGIEEWYLSTDSILTAHPAAWSFSNVYYGMLIDQGEYYMIHPDLPSEKDNTQVLLFTIQDITVPHGHYEDAIVIWYLDTKWDFTPLNFHGKEFDLGLVLPERVRTNDSVTHVEIYGFETGFIAIGDVDAETGSLNDLAVLKQLE